MTLPVMGVSTHSGVGVGAGWAVTQLPSTAMATAARFSALTLLNAAPSGSLCDLGPGRVRASESGHGRDAVDEAAERAEDRRPVDGSADDREHERRERSGADHHREWERPRAAHRRQRVALQNAERNSSDKARRGRDYRQHPVWRARRARPQDRHKSAEADEE